MRFRTVSKNAAIQRRYEESRAAGTSPSLAEVFAFREPPGLRTGKRMRSRGGHSGIEKDKLWPYYRRLAEDAGVNVENNVYFDEVAEYPGDPNAWCRDLDEVRKRIEDKGWSAEGDITVKPRDDKPPEEPETGLDEEDVQFCLEQEIKEQEIPMEEQAEFRETRGAEIREDCEVCS